MRMVDGFRDVTLPSIVIAVRLINIGHQLHILYRSMFEEKVKSKEDIYKL